MHQLLHDICPCTTLPFALGWVLPFSTENFWGRWVVGTYTWTHLVCLFLPWDMIKQSLWRTLNMGAVIQSCSIFISLFSEVKIFSSDSSVIPPCFVPWQIPIDSTDTQPKIRLNQISIPQTIEGPEVDFFLIAWVPVCVGLLQTIESYGMKRKSLEDRKHPEMCLPYIGEKF